MHPAPDSSPSGKTKASALPPAVCAGVPGSDNMAYLSQLTLTQFRSYARARLLTDAQPVVLTGPNGAGKTNLLEAISYLVPGRGLRGARLSDVARRPAETSGLSARPWAVAARVTSAEGETEVGTGLATVSEGGGVDKRVVKIDGVVERGQAALGRVLSALWLTPAMDRIFLEGASVRRRFVDRLVVGLDPEHTGTVAAYERSLRNRNRLLREGGDDGVWLDAVEDSMARHGVALAARRRDLVVELNRYSGNQSYPFSAAVAAMIGTIEAWLEEQPALAVEDRYRAVLADARQEDAKSGMTTTGPHRSDLETVDRRSGMPAAQCSTGEQKAMLIGLIIAAAQMLNFHSGRPPLLLMDEVTAHLDAVRRDALFEKILDLESQAWFTGTDLALFSYLDGRARFFAIRDGEVMSV